MTTTTNVEASKEPIVLLSDGLGIVSLGDLVDDVWAILTDRFGSPSSDRLYESPFDLPPNWEGDVRGPNACFEATGTGHVCYDYLRFVDWNDVGLYVLFSDIARNPEAQSNDDSGDPWIEVEPSFQGYGYGGGEGSLWYTADGITIGSTTADLLSLGDRVMFWWDDVCGGGVEFRILDPGVPTDQATWTEGLMRGSLNDRDFDHFEQEGLPHQGATVGGLATGPEAC